MFLLPTQLKVAILLLIFAQSGNAQIDFDKYRTLKSEGEIPEVFLTSVGEKYGKAIRTTYKDLNKREKKMFVDATVISIHDMLMDGSVIFGDTITRYINRIADKLLENDQTLRDKLSFYTTKSFYTNAMSTSQGIIFVTTGLIGQMTNEAQLAFVLAHEIAHYEKEHALEKYQEYLSQSRKMGTMEKILEFSREKENEADARGAEIYSKAGYKMNELNSTLDVLMYSYMPFDEVPLKKNYFNNKYAAFGLDRFGEVGAISAVEDFNDKKSTHPNISERRNNIDSIAKSVGGEGDMIYFKSESHFQYVRKIARFEMLRSYLASEDYINAMYACFLLEQDYPTSYFVQKCKARTWYGIASYDFNDGKEKSEKDEDWEGEVSLMNNFVASMTGIEKVVYTARLIEDVRLAYPSSEEMKILSQRSTRLLAKTEEFKIDDFAKEPAVLIDFAEMEKMVDNWYQPEMSKYEKIARKRGMVRKIEVGEKARPDHEFWIPDLINSSEFISKYDEEKKKIKEAEEVESELKLLRGKKLQKRENELLVEKMKSSDNKLLIVQPQVSSIVKSDGVETPNLSKYNAMEIGVISTIKEIAQENRISIYNVGIKEFKSQGVSSYNELMTIYTVLSESYDSNEEYVPIDFEDLQEIKENYDVTKLVLPVVSHVKTPVSAFEVALGIIIAPMIVPFLPAVLINNIGGRNVTRTTLAVFDLETYNFGGYYQNSTNAKPTKHVLGSQIHNFLTTIKK